VPNKRKQYRHPVELESAEITPLASVDAHMGEEPVRVVNISIGGLALVFEKQKEFNPGDVIELSLSIRDRAFPIQVEIKANRGLRYSCQFVEISPACENALEAFMGPKTIGESFVLNEKLSDNAEALSLVKGAKKYRAFVGKDESVAFVWLDEQLFLKRLFVSSNTKVLEWTSDLGLRTGVFEEASPDEPRYHSSVDEMLKLYFADIVMSWMPGEAGMQFTKQLLNIETKELQCAGLFIPVE